MLDAYIIDAIRGEDVRSEEDRPRLWREAPDFRFPIGEEAPSADEGRGAVIIPLDRSVSINDEAEEDAA